MNIDTGQALHFINQIWPDGSPDGAYLVLSHIVEDELISKWTTLRGLSRNLSTWLQTYACRYNTYFGVGLRDPGSQPARRRRGGRASVYALPGLVLDLDDLRGVHEKTELPRNEHETLSFLHTLPLKPSLLVDSSGGIHAYYLFKEPFLIESETERDDIEALSERFREYVIDAARQKPYEWQIDMLSHLDLVLRLPGSLNHKTGRPVPVALIHDGAERYNPSDFEDFLPPAKPRPKPPKGKSRTHLLDIVAVTEHYGTELTLKNKYRGEWEGAHPHHGSTTGDNFNVNPDEGLWKCWRCNSGGDALLLIAVCEGLIECEAARAGIFSGNAELYKQVVAIANEEFDAGIDWKTWVAGEIPEGYEGPGFGDEDVPQAIGQDELSAPPSQADWEAPLPLPGLLPDVPEMTDDMLPHGLRAWLTDIADRVQCPLEYVAVAAVVALAAVIGRRVGIYPKQHDDWLVIPNLWGMLIGRPGVLKTPAMVEAIRPLDRLVAQALRDHSEAQKQYAIDAATHAAKVKAVKSEMSKAAKKGDDELMGKLENRLAQLITNTPECPVALRYKTNDATVEKLQDLLSDNPNGLLLYRDELAGFLYALEKPGREGDREFYLECWNGNGSFTLDRIGRGMVHSTALCLSLLGSIQPGKLMEYVGGAIGGGISDDGLLQRLQLAVWPDTSAKWANVDRWPDTDAKTRAWQIVERLASLKSDHIPKPEHSKCDDQDTAPAIRFSTEAQVIFDEWRAKLEVRLRSNNLHPAMESHLAKYRSLMPSLALIFHLTFHAHQVGKNDFAEDCITPVSEYAANMAISWCDLLEKHALRVYAADIGKDKHRAHALARHILAGDVSDKDPVRTIYRHHWLMLKNPEDVYAALTVLEHLHWVRIQTEQTGGRSRDVIRVNPAVTDEKFSPFSQVTGAKSDKSPAADPKTYPSGTSGTCHLENGAEKISHHGGGEEEENSEKMLLVPGVKSDTRCSDVPDATGDDIPPWWHNRDTSF